MAVVLAEGALEAVALDGDFNALIHSVQGLPMDRISLRPIRVDAATWVYEVGLGSYKGVLKLTAARGTPSISVYASYYYSTDGATLSDVSGPNTYMNKSIRNYERKLLDAAFRRISDDWRGFYSSLDSIAAIPSSIKAVQGFAADYKREGIGRALSGRRRMYVGLEEFMPEWLESASRGMLSQAPGAERHTYASSFSGSAEQDEEIGALSVARKKQEDL